jgi:general stress protein YciG
MEFFLSSGREFYLSSGIPFAKTVSWAGACGPNVEGFEMDDSAAPRGPSMVKRRGFASMDAAKQREIASKGGKAAHLKGTAHEFTPEEARAAGRKGGQAAHGRGTAHKFTSEEARAAGRKGGRRVRAG